MLKKVLHFVQNFMPYKMIYHLSHKFVFPNICFSPFCEHFHHLSEKYTLTKNTPFYLEFHALKDDISFTS